MEIGGHNNQRGPGDGVRVFRENGCIVKRAYTPWDIEGIKNEARFLTKLAGTGAAPTLLEVGEDWISQEDLGESRLVRDGESFRHNCTRLLWKLRQAGVRHGDLTGANIIISDDRPIAIDFQQSNFFDEDAPQKRPLSDEYLLWRWAAGVPALDHPTLDTPRVIRRWLAVLADMGGVVWPNQYPATLLDLGCYQGDFTAMAAASGMEAVGVDTGGFRQGGDSITEAETLWGLVGKPPVRFCKTNIVDIKTLQYEAVLLFSTWAYMVQDFGKDEAIRWLGELISKCGVLYFETQLAGDGPGPDFLVEDKDVANLLGWFGTPQPLVTIPVTGRQAERTVWKVKK